MNALDAYASTIKIALRAVVIALVLGVGLYGGCSFKEHQLSEQIQAIELDRDRYKATAVESIKALEVANAQVVANKKEAEERKVAAESIAKEATAAKKKLADSKEYERTTSSAKEIPACQKVLEMKICPELMDY